MSSPTDDYTIRRHKRQELFEEKTLRKLDHIERRMTQLMTQLEDTTAAFETLVTDVNDAAAKASAEFAKLEEELAAGNTEPELGPLKESIEALDARAKAAAGEIPTN